MCYRDSEELVERLYHRYPENKKYLEENEKIIKKYFDNLFEKNEVVIVENSSSFWQCMK